MFPWCENKNNIYTKKHLYLAWSRSCMCAWGHKGGRNTHYDKINSYWTSRWGTRVACACTVTLAHPHLASRIYFPTYPGALIHNTYASYMSLCNWHSLSYPVEQAETRFAEIKHINHSVGTHVVQDANSPRCCGEPWHRDVGGSGLVSCFSCTATQAPWCRCQPARRPPEDKGHWRFSKWRRWQAWGGINPLRARGEIMRMIWLFWWSYATSNSAPHAVWSCGLLFISFHLIHNCTLNARGSVTDGESASPICWLKKRKPELMSDEIKDLYSGHIDLRDVVILIQKPIQCADRVKYKGV